MSYSSKLIKLNEGVWDAQIYNQSVRNTANNLDLQLESEIQGEGCWNPQYIASQKHKLS